MKIFCALKSADNIGGAAPEEFRIFEFGTIEIEDSKPIVFDEAAAKAIIQHFDSLGHDMVIDYEHQTLDGGKAPAAGWITALAIKADGLYATVKWTDEAKTYLENGEYRYFSPVFFSDEKTREIIQLYNLALTNQPRLKNINALAAKATLTSKQEEPIMWEKLKKLFNLKDDSTEDEALEACKVIMTENKTLKEKLVEASKGETDVVACKEVLTALDLDDKAEKTVVIAKIEAIKAPEKAALDLSRQVADLTLHINEMKRDDLVAQALKDGKIAPEEIEKWGKDLAEKNAEMFEQVVLSRPKGSVIPIRDLPADDPQKKAAAGEAELTVAKLMGNTEEDIKKYGG